MKHGYTRADRVEHAFGAVQIVLGTSLVFFGELWVAAFILVLGGNMLLRPAVRRDAFNDGWVRGRVAMVLSMSEAQARGMQPVDWLIAEAERDGFNVTVERGERD